MKTSTKVIIKFQLFSIGVLTVVLFFVNILYFRLGIQQYEKKIEKIMFSPAFFNSRWWKLRNWQKIINGCFTMYQEKYCLSSASYIAFGIFKIKDKYFLIKGNVALDIDDFFDFL